MTDIEIEFVVRAKLLGADDQIQAQYARLCAAMQHIKDARGRPLLSANIGTPSVETYALEVAQLVEAHPPFFAMIEPQFRAVASERQDKLLAMYLERCELAQGQAETS